MTSSSLEAPDPGAQRAQSTKPDLPSADEVQDFSSRVDEISVLIDGLSKGTISAEYVDSKLQRAKQKEEEESQASKQPDKVGSTANDEDWAAKKEALQEKVAELKKRLEMKRQARERYNAYVEAGEHSTAETDYLRWDMWCPSDEDDELLASCTPDNAQLKAMEKDIDERHNRMVKDRQRAERCRVAGIEAFRNRQWAEAYRFFEEGVTAERTNVKLHSNAAMASLKMGCYVQALEHCDKVIRLHEFMLNKPEHPLVVKAWQRKAAARAGLKHYKEALEAIEAACLLAPDDPDVVQQTERVQRSYNEQHKLQELQGNRDHLPALHDIEAAACKLTGTTIDRESLRVLRDRSAQGLPQLHSSHQPNDVHTVAGQVRRACTKVTNHLSGDGETDLRVYFRSCGGLTGAARCLSAALRLWPELTDTRELDSCREVVSSCAGTLTVACALDTNGHVLCGCVHDSKPGAQTIAASLPCHDFLCDLCGACDRSESVAELLYTLTTDADSRACVASALDSTAPGEAHSGGDNLFIRVLKLLPELSGAHQVIATSVLANCVSEKGCGSARHLQEEAALQPLTDLLFCGAHNLVLCQHSASLLGNAAMNPRARNALATEAVLGALAQQAQVLLTTGNSADLMSLTACLTALFNLALEKQASAVPSVLGSHTWHTTVLQLLQHSNPDVLYLANAITARVATCGSGAVPYNAAVADAVASVACEAAYATELVRNTAAAQADSAEKVRRWEEKAALKVIDAAVRFFAACGGAGNTDMLQRDEILDMVLWACNSAKVMDGCAGNAALCLSYVAESRVDTLRRRNAVKSLVECAYTRKGTSASRNAAIAAAKLAQDPGCLEQLRECRGLEVIHSYVKL